MSRKPDRYPSLRHCNGHLLCAIDVETTGVTPGVHDIVQVAFLPLDAALEPVKGVTPFYMSLKPLRPHNITYNALKINRLSYLDMMKYANDPDYAADLFTDWVARLNLPLGKKLMPLWSNGTFDRGFLIEWLGPQYYDDCIYFIERDTQHFAMALNDKAALHGQPLPFNRVGLNSLAEVLGVENENPHDALSDCLTTAAVYKAMLQMQIGGEPGEVLNASNNSDPVSGPVS